MVVPPGFAAGPQVQGWIKHASTEACGSLAAILPIIRSNPLPGGSLLRIMAFKEPGDVPSSFTVPFSDGNCLLLYELPIRADEPIRLLSILDPYTFSA